MAIPDNNLGLTFDAELELKDAYLVASSAAAQVDSSNKIVTVGNAVFMGVAVIDVSAIEVDSSNEVFDIIIQGSTSPTFASGIENLAAISLAPNAVRDGGAITSTTGRYLLLFINVQDSVTYPYLRAYTKVAGTIATGINYAAWIGKKF